MKLNQLVGATALAATGEISGLSINSAGNPRWISHRGAWEPSTMAAVAAALASTQLAAATDAVRQRASGFRPVRGSTM